MKAAPTLARLWHRGTPDFTSIGLEALRCSSLVAKDSGLVYLCSSLNGHVGETSHGDLLGRVHVGMLDFLLYM